MRQVHPLTVMFHSGAGVWETRNVPLLQTKDIPEVPVDAAKHVTRQPKQKKVNYTNFNLGLHCKCIVTIVIQFGYLTQNFVVLISGKVHRQQ